MKTKIIMIRHGFSVSNKLQFFTGNLDIELSDIGKEQAKLCGKYFKKEKIDAIYSSDLIRAYDTAVPISEATGLEIIKEKELREIRAGDWEGVPFNELEEKYPYEYGLWRRDIGKAICPNGESVKDFSRRIINIVTKLAEENTGKTICITTHATPIRVMCTYSQGIPIDEMAKVQWIRNASMNVFDFEDGIFTPVILDYVDHLENLHTALPDNV